MPTLSFALLPESRKKKFVSFFTNLVILHFQDSFLFLCVSTVSTIIYLMQYLFSPAPEVLQNSYGCSTWFSLYFYCEELFLTLQPVKLKPLKCSSLWPLTDLIHLHCTPSSYLGNLLCAHWSWLLKPCHPLYNAPVACLVDPRGPSKDKRGETRWWQSREMSLQKASLNAKHISMGMHPVK